MIAIGQLADRGPVAAASTAAALLAASLLLPVFLPGAALLALPLLVGSAAVVVFVVLRRGELAALRASGFCLAILVVLSLVVSGSFTRVPLVALTLWLPAVLAAIVLRRFVRLDLAVIAVVGCGLATTLIVEMVSGGGLDGWRQAIDIQLGGATRTGLTEEQYGVFVDALAARVSGAMGVTVMLVALCALFLGRSWQAAAVKPGGFQQEFHALALGKSAAVFCIGLIALAFVLEGTLWDGFAFVAAVGFCIQGLAIAHALVRRRGMAKGWLVGLYVMLMLPHTVLLLAALGLADNVVPLRGPASPPA